MITRHSKALRKAVEHCAEQARLAEVERNAQP